MDTNQRRFIWVEVVSTRRASFKGDLQANFQKMHFFFITFSESEINKEYSATFSSRSHKN